MLNEREENDEVKEMESLRMLCEVDREHVIKRM